MNEKQVCVILSKEDAMVVKNLILGELTERTTMVMSEDEEKAHKLVVLASEFIKAIEYAEQPITNVFK